jgi:hypothetical protein
MVTLVPDEVGVGAMVLVASPGQQNEINSLEAHKPLVAKDATKRLASVQVKFAKRPVEKMPLVLVIVEHTGHTPGLVTPEH